MQHERNDEREAAERARQRAGANDGDVVVGKIELALEDKLADVVDEVDRDLAHTSASDDHQRASTTRARARTSRDVALHVKRVNDQVSIVLTSCRLGTLSTDVSRTTALMAL